LRVSENRETRMPLADGRPLVIHNQAILQAYTLELRGPDHGLEFTGISPLILREAEQNITDLLPEGYSVRIKEWDAK
jgi:hypothetical protein